MAKVTIRVPSFEYTYTGLAENEDEVWDSIDTEEVGTLAVDKAEILSAEYDEPEDEEELGDQEEPE